MLELYLTESFLTTALDWNIINIYTVEYFKSPKKVIDYINGYEDIPKQNALRLFLENDSWFAIRPSGTEPKIKFYFYSKQNCAEEAAIVNGQIKEEILNLINAVE